MPTTAIENFCRAQTHSCMNASALNQLSVSKLYTFNSFLESNAQSKLGVRHLWCALVLSADAHAQLWRQTTHTGCKGWTTQGVIYTCSPYAWDEGNWRVDLRNNWMHRELDASEKQFIGSVGWQQHPCILPTCTERRVHNIETRWHNMVGRASGCAASRKLCSIRTELRENAKTTYTSLFLLRLYWNIISAVHFWKVSNVYQGVFNTKTNGQLRTPLKIVNF